MKKSLFIAILLTLASVGYAQTNGNRTARIYGTITASGKGDVLISYTGISGDFGNSEGFALKTNGNGEFDTVLAISKPGYFIIGRSILYVSPGDNLSVALTQNHQDARFNGKGAVANTFLSEARLYPKGGSYLEAGKNVKKDFQATKKTIDSLAAKSSEKLKKLNGVSEEFKSNEYARILANQANSYISYASYTKETEGLSADEKKEWREKFLRSIAPEVNVLIKIVAKDTYLPIKDVRDLVIYNLDNADFISGVEITPTMKEISDALECLSKLDEGADESTIAEQEKKIESFTNKVVVSQLKEKIRFARTLLKGSPAYDIELQDKDGKTLKLSDFKGKVIYIDMWATWCGPCLQEAPFFAELSKKYKDETIVFLPISSDSSRKQWENFIATKHSELPQYHTQDNEALRTKWMVKYIPRFILIDKDFNIWNAYAERPSSGDLIEKELNTLLGK